MVNPYRLARPASRPVRASGRPRRLLPAQPPVQRLALLLQAVLLGARSFKLGDEAAVEAAADAVVAWLWPGAMAPPPQRALRPAEVDAERGDEGAPRASAVVDV